MDWTGGASKDWISGDDYIHLTRSRQDDAIFLQWLEAEDLNVANMIVANKDGAFLHDREFFRGDVDPASTARYILYWGQEYRNSDPLGHMVFLNIKSLVVKNTSDRNTDNMDETLANVRAATDNIKELTDTLKRKPSILIRGETGKDRQPGSTK